MRAERFDLVDPEAWSSAVGSSVYLCPGWFRSVEGRLARPQRYVLADCGGAAGAFYRTAADTYWFFSPLALLTSGDVWKPLGQLLPGGEAADAERLVRALAAARREATVCVSPFGYTQPIRRGAPGDARRAVLDELERTAAEWNTATAAVLYADASDRALGDELEGRGFIRVHAGANCVLDGAGQGLEAYLRRLSASRRSAVRKEMRRFAEHGLAAEPAELSAHVDELARFQASLQAKYGHAHDVDRERETFRLIAEHLSDYAHVDLVTKRGSLVGFVLYFVKDEVMFPKMVGYDYGRLERDDYAYFNATYYNLVRRAADFGVDRIEYGTYAYDVKLTRGCRGERLVSYVRPDPSLRPAVAELATLLADATERLLRQYEST